MTRSTIACLFLVALLRSAQAAEPAGAAEIEHGRYLVHIAGCNDCHTAQYGMSNGQVDEKHWLAGDALGWSGPWGTTYATNLRLFMQGMTATNGSRTRRPCNPARRCHGSTCAR